MKKHLLLVFVCILAFGGMQVKAAGVSELHDALFALKKHILGVANLNASQISAQTAIINTNIKYIGDDKDIIDYALKFVGTFESSSYGALFMNAATKNGFSRTNTSGKEIYHAIFAVQQGLLDYAYTSENLAKYPAVFTNVKFETSTYFPGAVAAPENSSESYDVKINATQAKAWGSPVTGEADAARRCTGCYVAPGSVVTVTVPESMVGKDYNVRVGAHSWDLVKKTTIKRLDRVSLVYPIDNVETVIANPLGGGIYIEVPYLANAGVVTVQIKNAVRSPFFSARSFDKTTNEEWVNRECKNLGPWADFESDKFMMQVPTDWVNKMPDPVSLMKDWDTAMDAISELFGLPLIRPKTVLYTQPDVMMRGNANYPGYPQSNYVYKPTTKENGYKDHWMVRGPQYVDWTVFHEVGHSQMFTKFYGEIESTVNLPYVAIQNGKFGMDLDKAFGNSISDRGDLTIDDIANMWMVTENFRAGKPMSKTNKPGDEVKYQHRGHGKYVEIVNLFGWDVLHKFWKEVNVDYMDDKSDYPANFNEDPNDSRILRLSKAAGVDLRPLIHFWGVQPDNAAQLKSAIEAEDLKPSRLIYDRLMYYKTIIPMNNEEFNTHAKVVYPNGPRTGQNPLYADGWYETWMTKYSSFHGWSAEKALQGIIDLYFPDGAPEVTTDVIKYENKTSTVLYPNPCKNTVKIITDYAAKKIEVYDIQGRIQKVGIDQTDYNNTLNLSKLNQGVYFVKIYGVEDTETYQIVKQ